MYSERRETPADLIGVIRMYGSAEMQFDFVRLLVKQSMRVFPFLIPLLGLCSPPPSTLPPYTAIQIARPTPGHDGLEVVPENLARLTAMSDDVKVAIVAVVGPYHSGTI